jgi:alanine dehydrogenase
MSDDELLYLSGADVAAVDLPPAEVIAAVDEGLRLKGEGRAAVPPKPSLHGEQGAFSQVMAAHVRGAGALGVKWISLVPANRARGLPLAHAVLVLVDEATGRPAAIMEAGLITAWRTGASVAVAAKYLARRESGVLGVLGCGVQARAAVRALGVVLPQLREVRCHDVLPQAMDSFVAGLAPALPAAAFVACGEAAAVAAGADVVVSAITMGDPADAPLGAGLLRPGALAVALDYDAAWSAAAMAACDRFVCDDRAQVLATQAAGERLQHIPAHIDADLGEIAAGRSPGRLDDRERVFCLNLGIAVEDLMTARLVLAGAQARGLGRRLPL